MSSSLDPVPEVSRKREALLSKDGKWRSFPKTPYLLQYVSTGNYYGRIKVGGKIFRTSLKTEVWSTAKLRLTDFLKEHQEIKDKTEAPKFSDAVDWYKKELANNQRLKPQSRKYRLWCLLKLERSWPELWDLNIDQISPESCAEWAAKLNREIACHYFNNTIGTLKQIIDVAVKTHKTQTGVQLNNPADGLTRTRITQKELRLPEPSQFKGLIESLRKKSGGWGPRIGDLIEFLAYGGMRINSEAAWVTWDDIDWQRKEIIVRGNPETGTKNSEVRRVPIISDMENLLTRLKEKLGTVPKGPIIQIHRCNEALARACKELGLSKITHHDLRHLFATRCIEAGVDVPTVSRWLGHKDGGALAMRTYGHLRNEHSRQMAERVKF